MRVLSYIYSKISLIICWCLLVIFSPQLQALEGSESPVHTFIRPNGLLPDDRADMICDYRGDIFLLQSNLNKIVKMSMLTEFSVEIGGFGFGVGQFNNPTSIYTNDGGLNIYVLDSENRRIVRLNSELKWLDQILLESAYDDQMVGDLTGLAINSMDEFYVSDPRNFRILKIDGDGKLIATISGKKKLIKPGDLVCDDIDYLYICDLYENAIMVIDDFGNLSGSIRSEILQMPLRIAMHEDKLLVLDGQLNSILSYDIGNEYIETLLHKFPHHKIPALAAFHQSIVIYNDINIITVFIKPDN